MVIPESRSCSEMKAATELPISERPTLSSVPSAPPVALPDEPELEDPPRSERISQLEARVSRLLDENRALLNERKQLLAIGDQRVTRANECLDHARLARRLVRAYVEAFAFVEVAPLAEVAQARVAADTAYQELVALIAKPL
jgi:hypothetical protein